MSRRLPSHRAPPAQIEDAGLGILGKEFEGQQCLMLADVNEFIAQANLRRESGTLSKGLLTKTIAYVQQFNVWKNTEVIKDVRSVCEIGDLTSFETAQLGNLTPSTAEEAKALIPSLDRIDDEELSNILAEIQGARRTQ